MKGRPVPEKRISSGEKPEDEIEIEEGEIPEKYSPSVQTPGSSRHQQDSRWSFTRGRMSRRSRFERREVQERLEEVKILTNRFTPQAVAKSIEIVCKDVKASIKTLDKVRRLMKWRDEFDFHEYWEILGYVQKVLTGLQLLHNICKTGQETAQSITLVQELMKTSMNYRYVLFSKAQKRDVEAWYKESMEYPVYKMDKMTDSKDSDDGHGKSTTGSRFKTDSESGEDQIEKSSNLRTPADAIASVNLDSVNLPTVPLSNQNPTSDNRPLSFKDKLKQQDTPTKNRTKRTSGDSTVQELESDGASSRSLKQDERTGSDDSTKRKESFLSGDKEDTKRQKSSSEETRTTAKSEAMTPDLKSIPNAFMSSYIHQQGSIPYDSSRTLNAKSNLMDGTTRSEALMKQKGLFPQNTNSKFDYPATPQYQQHRNLCCTPFSYCAWPQRVRINQEGQNRGHNPEDNLKNYGMKPQSTNLNGLGNARSVQYKPSNEGYVFDRRASFPPPPPPIVFKPRPISPDVIFESPMDSYWDELLLNFQLPKLHQMEHQEFRDLIFEGKLCLVLDLDFALLSTTKLSELDSDSDALLRNCVKDETLLPLFAKTFHYIEPLQIWVKLRPGLNKFLRIARNAFWIYGHTTRSREETEMILKLIDPDGCFFGKRTIYQERAPGESIFKKVKSLSPAMLKFAPITCILDDGCLSWEDPSSVFGIESYLFFPESKARFGLRSKSMFETKSDEEDCGFLMNALDILLQIRQQSFWRMCNPDQPQNEGAISKLPTQLASLDSWDVRRLMAEARTRIFQDLVIAFDRVLEPDEPVEGQILWRMATSLGAKCSTEITEQTTHVISVNSIEATESTRFVVTPIWIEASYTLWFRLNEDHYRLI